MMKLEDRDAATLGTAVWEWARRFGLESEAEMVALARQLQEETASPVLSPLSEQEAALIAPHVQEVTKERRVEMATAALETKAQLDAVALSSVQAAKHVKVGASRLRQLAEAGQIWAYRQGSQWRIPLTQFHHGELLPGWEQVWELIPQAATPVSVFRFLTIDREELGHWPVRDWLSSGQPVGPVLDLARGWYGP